MISGKYIIYIGMLAACSCNVQQTTQKEMAEADSSYDSTSIFVSYRNTVFCTPSPQLVNMYLKKLGIYPDASLANPVANIEKYTTTTHRALNVGVYGADLGYINIFAPSERTNEYIEAESRLLSEMGLDAVFDPEIFKTIALLRNDPDSLAQFVSIILNNTDNYLKINSQQLTSSLVIAGGWIESFYLLCNIYQKYSLPPLKMLLLQQKFVLDNVIKGLAPYYRSAPEITSLLDDMVDLAYDFDVFEFNYNYGSPLYKIAHKTLIFNNITTVDYTNNEFESLFEKANLLRTKVIH